MDIIDKVNQELGEAVFVENVDWNCDSVILIMHDGTRVWVAEDLPEEEIVAQALDKIEDLIISGELF